MKTVDPTMVMAAARRLTVVLSLALSLLFALASVFVAWLLIDAVSIGRVLADATGFPVAEPRIGQSAALCALVLVQLGILSGAAWAARAMFGALSRGEPVAAARDARSVAAWLWVLLIWGVAAGALGSLIATWYYPAGQHALAVQLGSAQATTIIAALMASFLARAFALGAELWQDHREII